MHLERKTFGKIIHEVTRDQHDKRNDEYVLLYQVPSSLIHGDPEGMHYIQDPNVAESFAPIIEFPVEKVNAMLVDAGNNSVFFCKTFVRRFHPGVEAFTVRVRTLERRFKELALKHTYDRPPHVVAAIQADLAEENEQNNSAL